MSKSTTIWRPLSGSGEVSNDNEGSRLLIDALSFLILATGSTDKLLLGSTAITPKSLTEWSVNDG